MNVIHRLQGVLAVTVVAAVAFVASACSTDSQSFGGDSPLRIVAATELADLEPVLAEASDELGFPIEIEYPAGTLENTVSLQSGYFDGNFDATWFATNRYAEIAGASDKFDHSAKIASSPVGFGVASEIADRLGWADEQPTWEEITTAVVANEFSFGMTDPTTSNSGFSALAAVSTAYADTGSALTVVDIARVAPDVKKFFAGQTLTSGSSGWLADTFIAEPERADAIINYESVLRTLAAEGNDIEVVIPADGVISADYPLSALKESANPDARAKVEALAKWFGENPQTLTDINLRPADPSADLPEEMASTQVYELPFPGSSRVVQGLQEAYSDELRKPGSTAFVLDTSESMAGDRIASLTKIMDDLIRNRAVTESGTTVGIRGNEKVALVPFNDKVEGVTEVVVKPDGSNREELATAVEDLEAQGTTALYDALADAYGYVDTSGDYIPSILLLSDGNVTSGKDFEMFKAFYSSLPPEQARIPIFPIVYGEANRYELEHLASISGGKVFDAEGEDLAEVFKEIRAYQ